MIAWNVSDFFIAVFNHNPGKQEISPGRTTGEGIHKPKTEADTVNRLFTVETEASKEYVVAQNAAGAVEIYSRRRRGDAITAVNLIGQEPLTNENNPPYPEEAPL